MFLFFFFKISHCINPATWLQYLNKRVCVFKPLNRMHTDHWKWFTPDVFVVRDSTKWQSFNRFVMTLQELGLIPWLCNPGNFELSIPQLCRTVCTLAKPHYLTSWHNVMIKTEADKTAIKLTGIKTSMQCIYCRDGCSNGWTLDVDIALFGITINIDVQHTTKLVALRNDVVPQRCFPPGTATLSAVRHVQCTHNWYEHM